MIWFMPTELRVCQPVSLVCIETGIVSANYDGAGTYDEGVDLNHQAASHRPLTAHEAARTADYV